MRHRSLWICLALAAFTVALYAPALRCQFIAFDDPVYVSQNRHVQAGFTLDGLVWAFRTNTGGNWHPLTMLSHMLDCQIYGLRPWGHHLTNVLFHAANSVLIFLFLLRVTGAAGRSVCVAALFAAHPVHVESVAWISERKDVLSAFFCLLTIWAYARYAENLKTQKESSKSFYVLASVFYILALMAKPMAVTLPFVLLLMDFWPLRRVSRSALKRLLVEKTPMFALSVLWCAITIKAQGVGQAIASEANLSLAERVKHTTVAYLDYLRVMVFPWHLSAYYPYQHNLPIVWSVAAGIVLALITLLAVGTVRRRPWLIVGWLWFVGMLVPVIGLVQVGGQGWADRYAYLPSIGFLVIVVWTGAEWAARVPAVKLLVPVAVAALAFLTVGQLRYWTDTITLFRRAMQVTDGNYLAMTLVGGALEEKGQLDDAARLYRDALACKPAYPEAHYYLGRTLEAKGEFAEAQKEYSEALRLWPGFEAAHIATGLLLAKDKKFDEAIDHYQAALKTDPESAAAESNWALALMQLGRYQESAAHYEQAIRLDGKFAESHENLGIDYLQTGRMAEGAKELETALELDPTNAGIRGNLGQAFSQQQRWPDAAEVMRPLVASQPTNFTALYQYGLALENSGHVGDAVTQYAAALRQNPDFPEALQHAAWIAATEAQPELRNGTNAVKLAERACELTGQKRPSMLLTLAAAYAEAGRFSDAAESARKAEELARSQGQKGLADEAARLRERFAAGRAFHAGEK